MQKESYINITNEFYDTIEHLKTKPLNEFVKLLNEKESEILKVNLDLLCEHEYGNYFNTLKENPPLNIQSFSPYLIHDAIIEISNKTINNFEKISKSLNNLGCQSIELRSYGAFLTKHINHLMNLIKKTRIRNVEIYLLDDKNINLTMYNKIINKNPIINFIVLHSSTRNLKNKSKFPNIYITEHSITDNSSCGNISKEYFKINLKHFVENKEFNSCLNKKISIDINGEIKNCPSIGISYGNIEITQLEDVVIKKNFKSLWNISKDKISICNVCEFRYICSDCRVFISDKNDLNSKPLKCKYDPIKGVWNIN